MGIIKASIFSTIIALSCIDNAHNEYPLWGIDVSHHQGDINWEKIKEQGVNFAYIKATEGGDFKDRLYSSNYKKAKDVGVTVGAYHFFTFCRSGILQATNFISTVKLTKGDLPPALDIEFVGNCKIKPEPDKLRKEIKVCIDKLTEVYGVQPVIYTTFKCYSMFIEDHFDDTPIWIRNTWLKPILPDKKSWTFWQFKVKPLPGIKGDVDHNVFNGDISKFRDLLVK